MPRVFVFAHACYFLIMHIPPEMCLFSLIWNAMWQLMLVCFMDDLNDVEVEQILDFRATKASFSALYFFSIPLLSAVPVACGARQPSSRTFKR